MSAVRCFAEQHQAPVTDQVDERVIVLNDASQQVDTLSYRLRRGMFPPFRPAVQVGILSHLL
jgi:hypothetical protein